MKLTAYQIALLQQAVDTYCLAPLSSAIVTSQMQEAVEILKADRT